MDGTLLPDLCLRYKDQAVKPRLVWFYKQQQRGGKRPPRLLPGMVWVSGGHDLGRQERGLVGCVASG